MNASYSRMLTAAVAALTALFLVDLFLDWRHVGVGIASAVSVTTTTTGWTGWGWIAGITAVALLMYTLLEVAGYIPDETGTEIPPAFMGIVVCLSTFAEFHNTATVNVMNMVGVDRQWPAIAGLVLGISIAVATIARLVLRGPSLSGRAHPVH